MDLPVLPPVKPMLAKAVAKIPTGMSYEPKWDGFRAIVFRDGDEIEIGSRNTRSIRRYFPELVEAFRRGLPDRCVLDGEIVVPVGDRLDWAALGQRVHPAASRISRLAAETPARFVAFDLLALGDASLLDVGFAERRRRLVESVGPAPAPVHVTPATPDADEAARWFATFEGAGLDGLLAKPLDAPYQPDKRVMFKIKHDRTADCVVAGYRPYAKEPTAVGSLLLGLYTDPPDGRRTLAAVGVSSAFPLERRRSLAAELAPLVTDLAAHPWAPERMGDTRTPWEAGESRWGKGKDLSFVPLRPELVVEVRYDQLEGPRFRHTAQFVRFRPDRDPESCGYAQLEETVRYDLNQILG
ncbi:ATP-dependent DNA ligase [Frankia sp. CNm7]|uniref:ATP-dependent DNA ligase n=1 Tax=Frankia nepalensis TaxID=1836974 RepID=UPI00193496AE|nr:ATP-dependent DNA ligase [Frankia nepalensis]MBL7497916.1 ATP-dependent DNA ligase [Frankia nepalensis]MBL7512715.1 ATP-dependent DNA ligase [Frankia nepalensis]MBL7520162.1 ATP-dependent DNA ligase [Frankia nepalensis]